MKAYERNGRKVVPYTLAWDNMPLDLSYLWEAEKPAGKHGFLAVQGDSFAFEDGTPARFFGVNFNSGANFPSHEHSRIVARRLAQTGLNLVRFHQMDAEWSLPNLFQFSRGRHVANTRKLDMQTLDRLDYLIYCLKQEGIYVYMDLLTYRRFKSDDGVYGSPQMLDSGKPYVHFDPRMIELQKEFCDQLWNHYNPYTNLAYKDEPAIVMTEIANENDMFHPKQFKIVIEPYRTQLEERYRAWAAERGIEVQEAPLDFQEPDDGILEFSKEITRNYYRDMMAHLRKIGVKIPITGTNWANTPNLYEMQLVTDFTDSHTYWTPWIGDQRKFDNRLMTGEKFTFIDVLSMSRALDRPFFVSEWDEPWPIEWRAESPLFLAAVGGFQGWSGFAIHTYRYGTNEREAVTGKIGRDIVIGNSYYRGTFDTYNDPAKFGLFYAAALMFRRGDVQQGKVNHAITFDSLEKKEVGMLNWDKIPAVPLLPEQHRCCMEVPGYPMGAQVNHPYDQPSVDDSQGFVASDTGELMRSWVKRYGTIDTPMTKAVYGMVGKQGAIDLTDCTIESETDFATIALSSLTADPLTSCKNILLTAVGRAENANMQYSANHNFVLNSGEPPIECEVIRAKISLKTDVSPVRVWSVDDEGYLTGVIPSVYENGVLRFEIGKEHESIYYLIQRQ